MKRLVTAVLVAVMALAMAVPANADVIQRVFWNSFDSWNSSDPIGSVLEVRHEKGTDPDKGTVWAWVDCYDTFLGNAYYDFEMAVEDGPGNNHPLGIQIDWVKVNVFDDGWHLERKWDLTGTVTWAFPDEYTPVLDSTDEEMAGGASTYEVHFLRQFEVRYKLLWEDTGWGAYTTQLGAGFRFFAGSPSQPTVCGDGDHTDVAYGVDM